MNTFVHAPGAVGQILKANWNKYDESGANPCTACESGSYYYFYDALGNVNGVLEGHGSATPAPARYYRWEMDAFGNPDTSGPSANPFLAMDQPGPKEHLTGKMFDTVSGLYYFHARWYDAEVGRFVSQDNEPSFSLSPYDLAAGNPLLYFDPDGGKEINIGGVPVINPPPNTDLNKKNDPCGCAKKDEKLIREYFKYWSTWFTWYQGGAVREKRPKIEQPEELESPTATTNCGFLNLGKKRIEFEDHSKVGCINTCIFEHELTHYNRHLDKYCKPVDPWMDTNQREVDAYCVTLNCINRMLSMLSLTTESLPAGCSPANTIR